MVVSTVCEDEVFVCGKNNCLFDVFLLLEFFNIKEKIINRSR